MLKEWKNKRQLSLLVAFALSAGGGQLFFNHAHAADVTGGDVYIDNTPAHPIPAVTPPAGGAIRSSSDNGDVHHNRLILDGVVYGANIYGGFTAGSGNADHNTLVFRNGAVTTATPYVIPAGGFSTAGNARYNTVIINGTGAAGSGMSVLGGYGGDGTKDLWTGNTLVVQRSGNQLRGVGFFQKVQFDLDNSIANGDTMLTIHVVWGNPVDWDKSSVTGVSDWIAHMRSQGINTPSLTLYTGAGVQLRNYAPTLMMNITDYEYGWRSNAAGTGTVIATGMTLDSSQFKGVTTPSVVSGITRGGYSVYGNTTQTNKVDINAGSHADVRAGYTNGLNGGSEHNTLNLTGGNVTNGYAGYTTGVHLLADPTSPTNPAAVDTSKNADAKNNTVNINGGTLNAGGKLYGGYIATNTALIPPDNVSAGNATGNIINIESGIFGGGNEIYGGYTNGTGEATGNTVNLGKSDGTFNAPTLSNVTLYGGGSSGSASDVVTGNTLNVNTNATAGNIKNFNKVSFNFNSSFNQANPMLNLVGGATSLDWNSITYTGTVPTGRSVLMQNMSTINFGTTYSAKEVPTTSDTHETVLDTDTGAGTAYKVFLDGNQFKSAAPTITTGSATKDVWAGRSVLGNTTTGNTLTLNGSTTHRDAYGGWTAGTGTSKAAKDSSTDNTVNLVNSTVRNIYGGFSSTASGNATDNKVNISGGTVSGTVHGGYLSHTSATGDATGNIVTITGGTMGDVYGGFTAGTGATTGNTVNLGSAADAVASGTTIGTIYGGNKTAATGNILNVYDSATAGNIANFDQINFKATSSHIAVGDTLLTLTTGATHFDWQKLHVDNLDSLNASAISDRILTLMHNGNNINLSNYTPTGTRGRIHTSDYEADITTDGNLATTQNVYLKGYRFQNNTVNYAGGTATEAWGGRSIIGNKVQNNKLTLTGGSATLNARGGMVENTERDSGGNFKTTGDAEKNKLILNTGAQAANAYGAEVRTKAGNATDNTATINAGTVGSLYGATLTAAGATGSATKNIVEIKGGSVTGNVYGSHIADGAATGSATDNTVTFTGGSVTGDVYGGFTNGSGNTTGNTVNLGDGEHSIAAGATISGTIYGGNKTADTGNTLNVNTNATAGNIAHFENLKFNINSSALNAATPMLTLNAGTATNNLDWGKLTVDATKFNSPIGTYEAYNLTLMRNVNGIDFNKNSVNTYSANGGIKSVTSGNFEFSIDTLGSGVHTTEVRAAGYQYKNHTGATYTAGDGIHSAAWAGRTAVGNKVENNKLTVTGGTINATAYGGLVENHKLDAHGNPLPTGDAEKNIIAISGGNVANAYGAEVRTKNGNATENTAEITNGTVGSVYGASLAAAGATGTADKSKVNITGGSVTGDVHGGHIGNAAATGNISASEINVTGGSVGGTIYGGYNSGAGNATGATINITGGSMGNVYGGYANTGATTGNTVNLGTETTAFAAGTTIGTIYGGNKADVTGNTLNVNSRNASAADVRSFENVNFDVAHNVSHGDTLLRLTNGANTSIDWSKMKLRNLDTITASPITNRILTLLDSTNDVTFTNYDATRAKEAKTDGDYEYVLNTENETASDKKVNVTGYRFANNKPTYSTGTNPEAWGGRTKIGNKVEKNVLKVTGGTITSAAFGGIAENTKAGSGSDGFDPNGDAAENKLILAGGTIHHGYGADVRTQKGNAEGNIIDLNGANVMGSLYAGALTHTSASGAATGNKVNLYSGTVAGDVYAGFANHNGTTTGNTIAIGDGTNNAAVTVTGDLVGGNKAATGNILDIKSKGAQAGSLSNFSTIKFNLGASVADGDTVLTLNRDTTLTYSTIEKPTGTTVSTWLGNVMEKNVHLFQMAGGKKLTLSGYNPATGSEREGDAEYSLVTDNNQDTTTAGGSLNLTAYKWQNANVEINSGAHADVFGGKTVYGTTGETKKNNLTLKAGANVTNAIAGDTQTASGTAEENTLKVEAGTATNACGAKTKHGKATKNKAIAQGGSVTNLIGAVSTNGVAEENTVEVSGGTVTNAMGAETLAGDATGNKAVITAGSVTGSLKGAQSAGKALKNTVEIKGGNISGAKIIGAEAVGSAEKNIVSITSTPTANAATEIIGGQSTGGDAIENTVNVNANITGNIYGGRAANASLRNTVNIADGITVTGNVYGGSCITAEGNTVNIGKGATVTGDVVAGNATGSNRNNIINLTGARVNGTIKGGSGSAGDRDNTLAIHHDLTKTSYAGDFSGIKNLHFYLSKGITSETPTILQLGATNKDIRGIDVGVGVNGRAPALKVNDVISLMKVNGGTLTTDADGAVPPASTTLVNHVEGMHGVSLLYGFDLTKRNNDELIATVTKAAIGEQTKSFVETRAAATDFINRGADLLAGPGISAAKKEAEGRGDQDKEARGYHLWAAMQQGGMEIKTGSYADTKGYNLSLGWARELKGTSATLTFTPFVEYGKGKYDSYLDDGTHGSGNVSYLGLGIMGRMENTQGLWAEAALHGGKTRSDYNGSLYSGTSSSYDSSNAYYAAHLGVGKEIKTNDKDKVNAYLRYFWSYQSGMQASINSKGSSASTDDYDFGAVNSNRVRLGFTYTHKDSDKSEIFAGLAWEYELSGKATASFQGYEAPSPSLRGGSGMLEVGYRFAPKDSNFSYDLHLTGWQGKRQGYTGGARVNWAF